MTDHIHYPVLIDNAMRSVVREVLKVAQSKGLSGGHHFYISYLTTHPQVRISEQLKAKYPKEITIVLQHQFWDFKVEDSQFHVTLSFGGVPEKLTVPFAALTAFADPSVKFFLQFQHTESFDPKMLMLAEDSKIPASNTEAEQESDEDKIISLDAFRKK